MTTEDLATSRPTATLRARRGGFQLCCAALLCFASVGAFAQEAARANPAPPAVASARSVAAPASAAKARPIFGDLTELQPIGDDLVVVDEAAAPETLSTRIQGVLAKAMTLLGTPYRWGGASPDGGFDCSGLVGYVFRTAIGLDLPRVSRQMATAGEAVDRASLVPGDLVFFGRRGKVNHVGIYMGEGRFLHAPRRGRDVTVSSLDTGYWAGKFMAARRVAM